MRILLILLLLPQFLLPLTAKNWKLWPKTSNAKIYNTADGIGFKFPSNGTVNYLVTNYSGSATQSVSASFRVTMDPGAYFVWCCESCGNTCNYPAKTRLYLERVGWDDASCDWLDPETPCQYRRWFGGEYVLVPGQGTITLALDPSLWSSVYGRQGTYDATATAAFYDSLQNLQRVGMPFGGGYFAGHGLSASGNITFELLSFEIQ